MKKLFSLLLSVLSGALAGAVFKQVWKLAAREEDAPEATDPERSWGEVLIAAALQGALFALVKAAVERSAVQSGRKLTASRREG